MCTHIRIYRRAAAICELLRSIGGATASAIYAFVVVPGRLSFRFRVTLSVTRTVCFVGGILFHPLPLPYKRLSTDKKGLEDSVAFSGSVIYQGLCLNKLHG